MVKKRNVYSILISQKEREHCEDQEAGGWTIRIGSIWLRIGTSGGLL
jgi:hypothetical protein